MSTLNPEQGQAMQATEGLVMVLARQGTGKTQLLYDVLGWLAAGMSNKEILDDFPELTLEDIKECLA